MSDRTKKKIEQLENTFNLAAQKLESISLPEVIEPEVVDAVVEIDEKPHEPVFELTMLKQDFLLVRQNLMKLINNGQAILSQAAVIDIGDLKSSQLEGLASIQTVIGGNLKLLIDIYEKITKIEKMQTNQIPPAATAMEGGGTYVDKQIVFTGSTTEMLALMNKNDKA